jgi:hypothetical protein
LLFAAYAVLFLFAENVAEVGLRDAVPPLGRSVIGAALALTVCGLVYRDMRRGALVASVLVAAFFGYGHIAKLLGEGVGRDQLLLFWGLAVLAVALVAWKLPARRVTTLTLALDVIAGVLVVMSLVQVVPTSLDRIAQANAPLPDRPAPDPSDPDIYFLVFDRYGSEESIEILTGVQNDLPAFLESRGFTVAHDARANYGRTAMSLASTFDMAYLDELVAAEGPGSTDFTALNEMLQDHEVGRTLRERGYRIHQLGSWFTPTATSRIADVIIAPGAETDFEVLLRQTTMLPLLDEYVTKPEIVHSDAQHRDFGLFAFDQLAKVRAEPGPKFVFAHILLPHPPYVFWSDGSYPTEAQRKLPEPERYAAQLEYTNTRIREVVDELLDTPGDRQPVIVIAADEGPYPKGYGGDQGTYSWETAPDDALLIKYGILDAFHFPDAVAGNGPEIPASISPVNTFRLVFDKVFGMDLPLLPDRQYTSRDWPHAFDLTDVTERITNAKAARSGAPSPTPGATAEP